MMLKTLTLAACLISATTAVAMAQGATGPRGGYDNDGMPPRAYKGPGGMPSYASSEYRGRANVYDRASEWNGNNGMPPKAYRGPGGMQSYASSEYQGRANVYDQASDWNDNNGMPPASYKGPGGMKAYKGDE